eukprot:TRINITY_DN6667_c0_g1_i5.p1 TRINITY_DN6667_c0_g1~~TRINITY_DN6667_c0_g1_i5.p1  ORF type:complete len:980 (-),score=177.52 TRINITY_DN6667_c0_g1_i5:39-2918(-)
MDDLERALTCNLDPETPLDVRSKAQFYLDQLKSSPEGWKLCVMKLLQNNRTCNEQTKFFCLQVIQEVLNRYSGLSTEEKLDLRRALLTYLQKVCNEATSPFVKNKLAQIFSLLFKLDFLTTWPTFIDDLLRAIESNSNLQIVDMFLRILNSIDQEVVSVEVVRTNEEVVHNQAIKDKMRLEAVPHLVDAWYQLLINFRLNPNSDIVRMILQNLSAYIRWIDVTLIVNERFLNLFMNLISNFSVRSYVVGCFSEIVNKGMSHVDKIRLLNMLQLHQFIEAIPFDSSCDEAIDFFISVSKLLNVSGGEIMQALAKLQQKDETYSVAEELLNKHLSLMFRYLAHSDDEVSEQVIPFARDYLLQIVKKTREKLPVQSQHLTLFLQIISNKIKFDEEYNFDRYGEYEEVTRNYRKNMTNLFKIVTQLDPQLVANFMEGSLCNLPLGDLYVTEATLYLFLRMGEGMSSELQEKTKEYYVGAIETLIKKDIPSYPHRAVVLNYFDIILRYSRFLAGKSIVYIIVKLMLDSRGVGNADEVIRSKACEIFCKILKNWNQDFRTLLPATMEALSGLLNLSMSLGKPKWSIDALHLLEGIGVIVGHLSPGTEEQAKYIEILLSTPVREMESIISNKLWLQDQPDNPHYTKLLCELILALGTFSKGFPVSVSKRNDNIKNYFTHPLKLILGVLQSLPESSLIRQKTIFFLHRMVEVLGIDILEHIPSIVTIYVSHSTVNDWETFILLINQIMSTFKEQATETIHQLFLPIVHHMINLCNKLNQNASPHSEEERELLALKRNYYNFIHTLVVNKLGKVLIFPTIFPFIHETFNMILGGCTNYGDPTSQQRCWTIFRKLTGLWAGTQAEFTQFLYDKVISTAFEVSFSPWLNLTDPSCNNVLLEISHFLVDVHGKSGNNFLQYLTVVLLPTMNTSPEFVQGILSTFSKPNPSELRSFLKSINPTCINREPHRK